MWGGLNVYFCNAAPAATLARTLELQHLVPTLQKFDFSQGGSIDTILSFGSRPKLDLFHSHDGPIRAQGVPGFVDSSELTLAQEGHLLVAEEFLLDDRVGGQHFGVKNFFEGEIKQNC